MGCLSDGWRLMAVTSIWPVKSRPDRVIAYARNPEKTKENNYDELAALHQINGVLEYAANDIKTEYREYVTGINCSEEYAAKQFNDTKLQYGKTGGRLCYHGYQSFKADEVDAATAHQIGVELAKCLWGDRFEVLVATHCNTGHYHNHFVINSVSFVDGRKFYNSHEDYRRLKAESDRLCEEHGLSVIREAAGRGKNYGEWLAEQNGKPTLRGNIRQDIDRAILSATTERGFIQTMEAMGYELKTRTETGSKLKYPKLRPPGAKGYFRFHKLGEGYALDEISQRIYDNLIKRNPFPEADDSSIKAAWSTYNRKAGKARGIYALYLRYCYELHIISAHPTYVKRVQFSLREDIAKLDKLDAETRFLAKTGISSMAELAAYKAEVEKKIDSLIEERRDLRNQLKSAERSGNELGAESLKGQIHEISSRLKELRWEDKLCSGIERRSGEVKEKLERLTMQQEAEWKEAENNELLRRGGRPSR